MIISAQNGYLELVQWLVEQGFDVNSKCMGYSLLYWASESDNLELVKWLVEHGADLSQYGEEALENSALNDNLDIVKWLMEQGVKLSKDKWEQILVSCANHFGFNTVLWLVEQGVDVNAKDYKGMTALHHVVFYNIPAIAQWLIEHGADVNAITNNGKTALTIACEESNDLKMVQLLVKHGADINPKRGITFVPYWFELWRTQSASPPVNYSIICYLMFHDTVVIVLTGTLILLIIILIGYRIIRKKQSVN